MTVPLPDTTIEDSEGSGSDWESAGGFIRDDPEVKKKKRKRAAPKSRKRAKKKVNYKEDEDYEDDEDDDADYVDAQDAIDLEDEEIVIPDSEDPPEPSMILEGSSLDLPIEVGDLPDEKPDEKPDKKPAKKKRKPRKKKAKEKKPKLTYFERRTNRLYNVHPQLRDVFKELEETPLRPVERAQQPEGLKLTMLPFQLEGLHWMVQQEEQPQYNGGILADEMGMGKTIEMISLLMWNRENTPNLVVAPTVALMQWKSEIEAHTGGALKVCMFHGANRATKLDELEGYDVVLTSYAVVESSYRKERFGFKRKGAKVKAKSLLHAKKFYRVILDEAHNIKDRSSSTAHAVNCLLCEKRWCLTGTPLQNRIGELYSLIRFLNIQPFCSYFCTKCNCQSKEWNFPDYRACAQCGHSPMVHLNYFNHFMLKNIQKFGLQFEGKEAFHRLQLLLRQAMLRRTKVERADDLGLPPKIVEIRRDFFNPEEKDLYQSLYTNSKRQFDSYVASGVVLNNYANIFTLITRMRQLADHPDLVLKKRNQTEETLDETVVCQLCDDEAEDPIESKCHHKFCRICISEYVESFEGDSKALKCPVCHIPLSIDLEQPAIEPQVVQDTKKNSIISRINMMGNWHSSTKIEALMEELYKSRSDRQTTKSIVFSQFTSMLDLVEWRLKRAGFQTVKLQGSMTPSQRQESIKFFLENPAVEVFLVSLKAGGVALNLVEANQVFIMDSWWNPALDTGQAADRIHRIGQYRPIRIVKLVIEDSIESRIIELQEKKANMVKATLDKDQAAASRLTPADMQFLFNN